MQIQGRAIGLLKPTDGCRMLNVHRAMCNFADYAHASYSRLPGIDEGVDQPPNR